MPNYCNSLSSTSQKPCFNGGDKYTSHEDCIIEAPEWLACEIKCEEGKTAAKLVMTADPMDDGSEARLGQIVITSPEGVTCTIDVKQDPEFSSVTDVTDAGVKVVCDKSGRVTVESPQAMSRIDVYNMQGMLVGSYGVPVGDVAYEFVLDAPGLYVVRVSGSGSSYATKVVF